ncbi:uncharacterized protein LOC133518633 isoform X2 [Cydia pomonella]|uniref:uncharacterized protein LOC133518633 isoform X2 n=1 Tax=Cydia pomonella TaxID=82600 RepID=UPI002ADE37EA|nr:uncharacterized protein LOC133518633 isoform X2 [Cydia pomonella]
MFINVVYKDAPELSTMSRRPSNEPDPSQEKTLLVNPDCPVRIMLEYIRKQCKLGSFTAFDLCDDSGCLLGLFTLETYAYATDRFEHKKESDRRLSVLPQLNQENRFYEELKQRVKAFISANPSPTTSRNSVSEKNVKSSPSTRVSPPPRKKK